MDTQDMRRFLGDDYEAVVHASLLQSGCMTRLTHALQRAQMGETVRLCFLGGSLTAPTHATSGYRFCYPELLAPMLQPVFPGLRTLNAGLCGTSPVIGYHQARMQLLENPPDIVVLEFAVNGFQTPENVLCYEAMVHDFLAAGCAVVSLFVTVLYNGTLSGGQYIYGKISEKYSIPMVSIMEAVQTAMTQFSMPWSHYAIDNIHAGDSGQQLIADCLLHLLRKAVEAPFAPQPAISAAPYAQASLLHHETLFVPPCGFVPADTPLPFSLGWLHVPGNDAPLRFSVNCRHLFVLYQLHPDYSFGAAEVTLDDRPCSVLEGYSVTSWNNPASAVLLSAESATPHEISVSMLPCDSDKPFVLLGFGVG